MCHRWGDRAPVAYTRSHSYSVVSGRCLSAASYWEGRSPGRSSRCMPYSSYSRNGQSWGRDGQHCYLSESLVVLLGRRVPIPVLLFQFQSFSSLCLPAGSCMGQHNDCFPLMVCQILGAVLSPEFGCLPSLCHVEGLCWDGALFHALWCSLFPWPYRWLGSLVHPEACPVQVRALQFKQTELSWCSLHIGINQDQEP